MTTIIMIAATIVSIPIIIGGAVVIFFWGLMTLMAISSLFESNKVNK